MAMMFLERTLFNATTVMRMFAAALVVVCLAGPSALGAGPTEDGKRKLAPARQAGHRRRLGGPRMQQERADPVQAMLDRVGQMAPSAQRAWLVRLEQRAARAARLTLRPEDAARQEAKTRTQLHQATISWQVLREVIRDTDQREKDVIDRLVRHYRYARLRQLSQADERL